MTTTYVPLTDSIPASDLQAGMFLHRVSRRPLSAVFEAPVDAEVLDVEPFTDRGLSYVKVTLGPDGTSTLNLAPNRPVQVA